jgi:Mimiviridae putative DNA helicase
MDYLTGLTAITALQKETNNSGSKVSQAFSRTDDEKSYDNFITHLHLMMKTDLLNSMQYTYFTEFAKIDGSLINIKFFIDLMEQIEQTVETEYRAELQDILLIDSYEEFDILEEIKEYDSQKKIKNSIDQIESIIEEVMGDELQNVMTDTEITKLHATIALRVRKIGLVNKFKGICADMFSRYLKFDKKNNLFRINKSIRYKLSRVDTIQFTEEQKTSLWKMYDFMIDPSANTFCFQGYAGTGKTTTIVELVSYLIRNSYIKSVAFTAPTNKAVNVIKNKFRPHLRSLVKAMFDKNLDDNFCFDDEIGFMEIKNIKISFLTIHKLLNFKTDYSVSGNMIFVRDRGNSSLIPEYELVLIDECSMINMDMIDSIFDEIRQIQNLKSRGFKRRAKIMFTGDPAQLPPVNEERSSIFSRSEEDLTFGEYMRIMNFKVTESVISDVESLLRHKYNKLMNDLSQMKSFLLTNVVRSRLDNVTHVCNEFRHLVADKSYDMDSLSMELLKLFKSRRKKQKPGRLSMPGVTMYQYEVGESRLQTLWFRRFLKSIKNGDTAIILTWTNRQTDQYNEVIRRKIFRNKGKIKKFEIGDILMLSEFYALDLGEDFVTQRLFTSEQIKVIKTDVKSIPLRGFEMIKTKTYQRMKQYPKINPELEMLIKYMNDEYCQGKSVTSWLMKVHRMGEDEKKSMAIMVVDDKDKDEFKRYKSTTNDLIRNFANKLLHRYKNGQKSIERSVIKPLWIQWRKIFDEPFASVNYGYSITTHKAQGSSFQDVYVDLNDILQNPREHESHKCAYTATTRTSNELHILI